MGRATFTITIRRKGREGHVGRVRHEVCVLLCVLCVWKGGALFESKRRDGASVCPSLIKKRPIPPCLTLQIMTSEIYAGTFFHSQRREIYRFIPLAGGQGDDHAKRSRRLTLGQ